MLGAGRWTAELRTRGGEDVIDEIPLVSCSAPKVIDNAASGSISMPGGVYKSIRRVAREWEHEIHLYRNRDTAFIGPVVVPDGQDIAIYDLSYWLSRRIIDKDLRFFGDLTNAFVGVFNTAMKPDPSPNITVNAKPCGISGVRKWMGHDVRKASDIIGELARTALDYTTIGRTIYVGGEDIFGTELEPLILHDGGVSKATVRRDGEQAASDYMVFCGNAQGQARGTPLVGRATRSVGRMGLVQRTATELQIKDLGSADKNALARLNAVQPVPRFVKATLKPEADFTFNELIPSRRMNVELTEAVSDEEVIEQMRLVTVTPTMNNGKESIEIELVPIGGFDEEDS